MDRLTKSGSLPYIFVASIAWVIALFYPTDNDRLPHIQFLAIGALVATLITGAIGYVLRRRRANVTALYSIYSAGFYFAVYLGYYYLILPGGETDIALLYMTPAYCLIIGLYLFVRKDWGLPAIFIFTLAIGLAHLHAMLFTYEIENCSPSEPVICQLMRLEIITRPLNESIFGTGGHGVSGFVGGVFGAGLSFIGLAVVNAGFHRPIKLTFYTIALGVLGTLGLTASFEIGAPENPWSFLGLYPVWQIVFSLMIMDLAGEVRGR